MCQQIFQWDPDMRQLWLWTVFCSKVRTSSFHGVFVLFPRGRTMPSLWQSGTQCSVQRWLYLEQLLRSCCRDGVCTGGRAGNEWKGRGSRHFPSPHIASLHLAFQREENHTIPLCFIHKEFELIDNGSWRRWRLRLNSALWVLLHPLYCYWPRLCNFNIRGWL